MLADGTHTATVRQRHLPPIGLTRRCDLVSPRCAGQLPRCFRSARACRPCWMTSRVLRGRAAHFGQPKGPDDCPARKRPGASVRACSDHASPGPGLPGLSPVHKPVDDLGIHAGQPRHRRARLWLWKRRITTETPSSPAAGAFRPPQAGRVSTGELVQSVIPHVVDEYSHVVDKAVQKLRAGWTTPPVRCPWCQLAPG